MTPEQAQAIHDTRLVADPGHDVISCWCCCTDCDFEQDEEGNVTAGPDATPLRHVHDDNLNCLACYYGEPSQFTKDEP